MNIWYDLLKVGFLDSLMRHGTTARTSEVLQHGNHALLSPLAVNASKKSFDTILWEASEADVFAPAIGLFTNLADMLAFSRWLLAGLEHRSEELAPMLCRGRAEFWSLRRSAKVNPSPRTQIGWRMAEMRNISGDEEAVIRLYSSESTGPGHSASITVCAEAGVAVVVLSKCSTGVAFAELASEVVLGALWPREGMRDVQALARQRRQMEGMRYRQTLFNPWLKARDLASFFRPHMPASRKKLALLVTDMVGMYVHDETERYITLAAHPTQLSDPAWEREARAEDLATYAAALEHQLDTYTLPHLETWADNVQLSMAINEDYPHQILALFPHHTEYHERSGSWTEVWSFMPRTDDHLHMDGCGHLRSYRETLVEVERSPLGRTPASVPLTPSTPAAPSPSISTRAAPVSALNLELAGRPLRFRKMSRLDTRPEHSTTHTIRRDWAALGQHLRPVKEADGFYGERSEVG
ncbi:MAG: hypothetical protein M1826_000909 [Phylliscum demangeonii]|nr:MAG: hypothetical protein M1826_000909 [Phylliscum demangeonii]